MFNKLIEKEASAIIEKRNSTTCPSESIKLFLQNSLLLMKDRLYWEGKTPSNV